MAKNIYGAIALTGGGTGALDKIDGASLQNEDQAVVAVLGGYTLFYSLDVDSALAESSPLVIAPDTNPGDKRWILQPARFDSARFGSDNNYFNINNSGCVSLSGTAMRRIQTIPCLDFSVVAAKTKPTQITRGIFHGYSLPIWNSGGNEDEQLFWITRVPWEWDGESNIEATLKMGIGGADANVGDKAKFQLSYQINASTGVLLDTNIDLTCEKTALEGRTVSWNTYLVDFTFNYTAGIGISPGDMLGGRLRRIDASSSEYLDEIAVWGWIMEYKVNKMYGEW